METAETDAELLRAFDWNRSDGPTHAIVTAIADEVSAEPVDIPPIHSAVDADALDSLFDHGGRIQDPVDRSVQFVFHGFRVLVEADGRGYLYDHQ